MWFFVVRVNMCTTKTTFVGNDDDNPPAPNHNHRIVHQTHELTSA